MTSITYYITDSDNPLHAIEIKDTVITLFYKESYRNTEISTWVIRTDKNNKEYHFIKDDESKHVNLHLNHSMNHLFHHHYDLGRPVEFLDLFHCLHYQRKAVLSKGIHFKDYEYQNFSMIEEGLKKLSPNSDTDSVATNEMNMNNPQQLSFFSSPRQWKNERLVCGCDAPPGSRIENGRTIVSRK